MATQTSVSLSLVARIAASLVGGYAFTWGVITLGITTLVALGSEYEQAYLTFKLLGFVLFLGLFLWSFIAKSVTLLWLTLGGGALVMTTLAWLLQNQLLTGA
ncbi:MAG TPA: iron uptake protein [Marinagarivorans sp.]